MRGVLAKETVRDFDFDLSWVFGCVVLTPLEFSPFSPVPLREWLRFRLVELVLFDMLGLLFLELRLLSLVLVVVGDVGFSSTTLSPVTPLLRLLTGLLMLLRSDAREPDLGCESVFFFSLCGNLDAVSLKNPMLYGTAWFLNI